MTARRIPIVATIVVLAAVAVMVRLGFWQLDRLEQKEALLARYAAASSNEAIADWSGDPVQAETLLYRRVRVFCEATLSDHGVSGRNARGQSGYVQPSQCVTPDGHNIRIILGWTEQPYIRPIAETTPDDRLINIWSGGEATGILAPGPRLVADPPLGGLDANARPDPGDIPNNHLAYAGQWFFFALTALLIYGIALRKRMKP